MWWVYIPEGCTGKSGLIEPGIKGGMGGGHLPCQAWGASTQPHYISFGIPHTWHLCHTLDSVKLCPSCWYDFKEDSSDTEYQTNLMKLTNLILIFLSVNQNCNALQCSTIGPIQQKCTYLRWEVSHRLGETPSTSFIDTSIATFEHKSILRKRQVLLLILLQHFLLLLLLEGDLAQVLMKHALLL